MLSRELSVIIVSYNVSPYLKICLYSVCKAIKSLDAEVFVVDNASDDDSVDMVKSVFPGFKVIANKENKGFSVANNQAIDQATGKIILLLNPDTIVSEDAFVELISFYQNNPGAAGVGVKMLDGSGNYLPESKRGLPSSRDFIFKFSGLIKVFPGSKIISRYFMGNLSPDKTWEIPVLAGAFLAFPSKALESIDPLDETFFMYGEDIDLSYRLSRVGKNYYYPGIKIIHFKGESTVKDQNYIDRFYGAMLIFTRKHFFPRYLWIQKWIMTLSINAVKGLLKKLLIFSSKKEDETERVSPVVFFVGKAGDSKDKIIAGFKEVKFFDSFDDVKVAEVRDQLKTNILIDLNSVSIQDMIDFMEKNAGMYRYSFLSPDNDFYLYSSNANTSGTVMPL